jgi:cysteine-rich repeat protein
MTITALDSPSACRTNCTVPRCGDGILDGGEVCDDGNVIGGDGCSVDCKSLR